MIVFVTGKIIFHDKSVKEIFIHSILNKKVQKVMLDKYLCSTLYNQAELTSRNAVFTSLVWFSHISISQLRQNCHKLMALVQICHTRDITATHKRFRKRLMHRTVLH